MSLRSIHHGKAKKKRQHLKDATVLTLDLLQKN